jgi:hypothetical protein
VELQPEWNEFLRLLKHHGVRFVLVGGLAVSVHGHERYTKDLDLLVDPSAANARRLGKALVEFGFVATGRAWRRLTKPYQILTLGVEPILVIVFWGSDSGQINSIIPEMDQSYPPTQPLTFFITPAIHKRSIAERGRAATGARQLSTAARWCRKHRRTQEPR